MNREEEDNSLFPSVRIKSSRKRKNRYRNQLGSTNSITKSSQDLSLLDYKKYSTFQLKEDYGEKFNNSFSTINTDYQVQKDYGDIMLETKRIFGRRIRVPF